MVEPQPEPNIPRKDVKQDWSTGQVDLTATSTQYLIAKIRGGQACVVKALVGNADNVYVGKRDVKTGTGFELSPGESHKFEYFPDKEIWQFIEIYAICATAGDDVCFTILP